MYHLQKKKKKKQPMRNDADLVWNKDKHEVECSAGYNPLVQAESNHNLLKRMPHPNEDNHQIWNKSIH